MRNELQPCVCGRVECARTKVAARLIAGMRCALTSIERALGEHGSTALTLRTIDDTTRNALAPNGLVVVECRECDGTGIGGQDEDWWLDCGCCGRYGIHTAEAPDEPCAPCLAKTIDGRCGL